MSCQNDPPDSSDRIAGTGTSCALISAPTVDEVDAELWGEYEAGRAKHAHFDSLRRLLLRFPPALRAADGMYDLMMGPNKLNRQTKEQIFVACSAIRSCQYSTAGHGRWLAENTAVSDREISSLVDGQDLASHGPVERSVISFARKVAAAPYKTLPEDFDALRLQGLAEPDIIEVMSVVSLSGWMNGYAMALGLSRSHAENQPWP